MKTFRYEGGVVLPGLRVRNDWGECLVVGTGEYSDDSICVSAEFFVDNPAPEEGQEVILTADVAYREDLNTPMPLMPGGSVEDQIYQIGFLVFRSYLPDHNVGYGRVPGFQNYNDRAQMALYFIDPGEYWQAEDGKFLRWTGEGFEILDEDPNPRIKVDDPAQGWAVTDSPSARLVRADERVADAIRDRANR